MRSRFRSFLPIASIAAALLAISCSKTGALDNGSFVYECVPTAGSVCAGGSSIPASIAVGAHFKLTYAASDTTAFPSVAVAPVSTDFFSVEDGTWVATRPGDPAVYATSGGLALDYAFVHIDAPATGSGQ
jgi:hypothetical protein